jgi:predicted HNH restriction endonuclease
MLAIVLGDEPGGATTVPQFSELLRGLPANEPFVSDAAFRSVLGLRTSLGYMKEINEAEGDWPQPDEHGNRPNWRPHFKEIWRRFGRDDAARAARVRAILETPDAAEEVEEPDFDEGFIEGRAYYGLHRRRERSQAAVQLKKQTPLICAICEFDFEESYGEHGAGYIECHHIDPLADTDVTPPHPAVDLVVIRSASESITAGLT